MKPPVYKLHGNKVTHRELYDWLAQPERVEAVNRAAAAAGYRQKLIPTPMVLSHAGPLPYFIFPIAKNTDHAAHCGGIYLDLGKHLSEVRSAARYYLPVIGISPDADDSVLAHEIEHLTDLLDLIQEDPTYPVRALQCTLSTLPSDADTDTILRCLDFELFKLNKMERKAAATEYLQGCRSIPYHFLFWKLDFPCTTSEQYVETTMALYIGKLGDAIANKCPARRDFITQNIPQAIDRCFDSFEVGRPASETLNQRRQEFQTWVDAKLPIPAK
jgi:hypothetical protein